MSFSYSDFALDFGEIKKLLEMFSNIAYGLVYQMPYACLLTVSIDSLTISNPKRKNNNIYQESDGIH